MVVQPIFLFIHFVWLLIIRFLLAIECCSGCRCPVLLWNMNCMYILNVTEEQQTKKVYQWFKRRSFEQMSWIDSTNGARSFTEFDYCNLTFGFGNENDVQHLQIAYCETLLLGGDHTFFNVGYFIMKI